MIHGGNNPENDLYLCHFDTLLMFFRGLLALQTLHRLQNLTGKKIHQLFDYICGVSTGMLLSFSRRCVISPDVSACPHLPLFNPGAILAFMLGIFQIPLEECEQMYRKLGADVFKQNVIVGTVKMGWSHAFYDSEIWENILRLVDRTLSFFNSLLHRGLI